MNAGGFLTRNKLTVAFAESATAGRLCSEWPLLNTQEYSLKAVLFVMVPALNRICSMYLLS